MNLKLYWLYYKLYLHNFSSNKKKKIKWIINIKKIIITGIKIYNLYMVIVRWHYNKLNAILAQLIILENVQHLFFLQEGKLSKAILQPFFNFELFLILNYNTLMSTFLNLKCLTKIKLLPKNCIHIYNN